MRSLAGVLHVSNGCWTTELSFHLLPTGRESSKRHLLADSVEKVEISDWKTPRLAVTSEPKNHGISLVIGGKEIPLS
jgi:hypothetical protein